MDCRPQRRRADAALWLRAAHLGSTWPDRRRSRHGNRHRTAHHRQGRQDKAGARAAGGTQGGCRIPAALSLLYRSKGAAVPRCPRRPAQPGDRPARDGQAALGPEPARHRDTACVAPFLRHASAWTRRRPAHHPGAARPCQPVDHTGLYRRRHREATRYLRAGASARLSAVGRMAFRQISTARLTVLPLLVAKKLLMKRVIAIADRAAPASLKLLAALNVLFFLSFLVVLLLADRALAEAPVCAGTDLLASLAKSDPATFNKVETEAAAVPNGKGLLWKLEKSGEKPSFLFGTMHMTDARVTTLPTAAQKAYAGADTIIIETTDALDKAKMMAA